MKKFIVILFMLSLIFLLNCKDIMEETMYDKEHEKGEWNSAEWNNAQWQ